MSRGASRPRSARRAGFALGVAVAALAAAAPSQGEDSCTALTELGLPPHGTVASATAVAANAETDAPAFCEVAATLSPVEGSSIGVVYRLPEDWNGKLLGLGGGGWMGNVRLETALAGLRRGYATLQTDAGHAAPPPPPSPDGPTVGGFDTAWALRADDSTNMVAIEDFAHRAVHEMTVAGKAVAAAYYGRAHERAYWQGCSTGGRQGLMEVQRYPQDYDGVIAGAPVYDLRTQTSGWVRAMNFDSPGRRLAPAHLSLIHGAVLGACDAADGAEDGVVQDPRACAWDPGELACGAEESGDACLTLQQVDAVRIAYEGLLLSDGSIAAFPLSRGSEDTWARYTVPPEQARPGNESGLDGLNQALFGDGAFDMADFDPEVHVGQVRNSGLGRMYEAGDPDIADFLARGGRLLLWHGFYDNGPSAIATLNYYDDVVAAAPAGVDQSVRLFLAPGVGHCRGGPGPDQFDLLTAMEQWVEEGRAPDEMAATQTDSDLAWPVCAYPKLPRGRRDENGETTYVCE